jgi:hypothetical protein
VRPADFLEGAQVFSPCFFQIPQSVSMFQGPSDSRVSRDNVERQFLVFVFIGGWLPLEVALMKRNHCLK